MTNPKDLPEYRLPDLSLIQRQYVVRDERGRYGIAHTSHGDDGKPTLWARPIGTPAKIGAPPEMILPSNAVLITSTPWDIQDDGTYRGWWHDDNVPTGRVPEKYIRRLEIVDDLGYRLPDHWADVSLAGSDQMGHWDYGATLGKIGGEPPVKGQKSGEMTVEQAQAYAEEVGEQVTARGIRLAAQNGHIINARKLGRDWLIAYEGFNYYLDNRPKRGRPKTKR